VRIKPKAAVQSRPHLLAHARQSDIGIVAPRSGRWPGASHPYVIVHFDVCDSDHRLLESEIEPV
jgi:hypothetical protein